MNSTQLIAVPVASDVLSKKNVEKHSVQTEEEEWSLKINA
jgi:transcriptional antiterminator Rof (Rho-off)